MKPYGVRKRDRGCCNGHDKYPDPKEYIKKPKIFKKKNRSRKKRARRVKYYDE